MFWKYTANLRENNHAEHLCCIFSEHLLLRTPVGGCFWVNIIYNTVEAIDLVLQSDDKDIGEVVDNNDSNDSSEYEEDKNDNVTIIWNNEQGGNLDTVEQGDTVKAFQVERLKIKRVLGPVKSLNTVLDKNIQQILLVVWIQQTSCH